MSEKSGFLSFIEEIKSELNDIKGQMDDLGSKERKSNDLRASDKTKTKKNGKSKNKNKQDKSYGAFESSEGKSVMTSSMEGKSLEDYSVEGKSIMTTSMEGKSQMYNSSKMEEKTSKKEINSLENFVKKKNDKLGLKDRKNLLRAVVYSEIIGKPKSLR